MRIIRFQRHPHVLKNLMQASDVVGGQFGRISGPTIRNSLRFAVYCCAILWTLRRHIQQPVASKLGAIGCQ